MKRHLAIAASPYFAALATYFPGTRSLEFGLFIRGYPNPTAPIRAYPKEKTGPSDPSPILPRIPRHPRLAQTRLIPTYLEPTRPICTKTKQKIFAQISAPNCSSPRQSSERRRVKPSQA
jgi:hypothetical protein